MTHSIRLRVLAGTFVALVGIPALAACGDDGTTVSTKDGKVKVDDDKVTVETSEGTATVGKDLPEGFPKDVPLVDEDVVSGIQTPDGAWSVVMTSKRSVEDLGDEVAKDFTDAGWTEGEGTEMGDVNIQQFSNDRYEVGITIARTTDTVTVTYLVQQKS